MKDSVTETPLELEVSNFGPIVEAKIELRPLTVFVGPSNTGKSFLAILIYALHRFLGSSGLHRRRLHPGNRITRNFNVPRRPSRKTVDTLAEWAKHTLLEEGNETVERDIVLPGPIADVIRTGFNAQGKHLCREIFRCFGVDQAGSLIRKGSRNGAGVVLRKDALKDSAPFEHKLSLKAKEAEFEVTMPEGWPMRINTEKTIPLLHRLVAEMLSEAEEMGEDRDFAAWRLINYLADFALPQLVSPLHLPGHYLPADRTGVMHAHNVVVSAMFESAPTTGLRPATGTPMLSGVLADFLQQLIELDRPPYRRHRSRRDLGTQIEEAILGGSVRIERSETIDYPHFKYQPKGWRYSLPLMNSSSMVSELAPVVLYLRHIIEPDNVLIIEEPESHLHPAMQVEFTRQLAALVNAGVKVIVTTHSEWVLETLANLVRLSSLSKARRKGFESANFVLRQKEVGAWLFKPKKSPRGSVVQEIRFDPDSGGLESGYSEVAEQLYNEWAGIGNRIGGSTG